MSSRRKQFKPKSAIDVVDGGGGGGCGDEVDKLNQSLNMPCSILVSSTNEHSDECNERKRKRSTSDADGDDSDSGSGSESAESAHQHAAHHNDTMNDIDDFEEGSDGRLNQTTPNGCDSLDHSDYSQLNHSVMLLMFKCRVCGKGFKHRRSLNRHVKLHSGEKNFKCPFCTTAFARSDHLKAHIRTHNNSKPYRCSICQCGYSTQAALKVHIAHHHSKSKFKCVLCNELEFHSQLALEGHMYTMHSKENETADLNELINETATMNPTLVSVDDSVASSHRTKLTDINNLIKHEDVLYDSKGDHHSAAAPAISINMTISPSKPCKIAPKSLHCDQCDVTFSNMDSYSTHMRNCHNHKPPSSIADDLNYTTETQYQCSQCSLSLFKLNDYLQHIKREHCVEVYRCVLCKQMQLFDNLSLLKEHFFQVHQSVRVETYKCRLCAHTSISLDELSGHLASAHSQPTHTATPTPTTAEHQSTQQPSVQYSCQYCRNVFTNKAQLERHVRIHLSTIDLKCNICDRQFDNELQLAQHKLTHSLTVKVTCSFCQQPIEHESHFKEHFKRHNNIGQSSAHQPNNSNHNGKMSYSCVVCRQQLTSNNEYLTHMKSHLALASKQTAKQLDLDAKREASGACPLSPATTASSASSTTSQKNDPFLCEICSSKFDSNFKLQTHLLLKHEYGNLVNATYSCPVCDEAYNRADLLLQHTQIHGPAAKIYKCSVCPAAFVFKSQLINHSFSHQTKNVSTSSILHQQLSQPLCKAEATTAPASLNQSHYVVNTNANGSKTFTCLTCSKTFANQRNLNVHMRIHTGFRPFECDICNRKFTRRENLRSHMKCHLNLRPFTCSICNRSFRRKSHVSSHIEVHFKSKVHNCIECEQQFDQLDVFLGHLIAEHNIYDKELLLLIKSKQLLDLSKFVNLDCEYVLSQPSGSPASMSLSSKPCAQQTVAHNAIPPLHHYQSLKTEAAAMAPSVRDYDTKYYEEEDDDDDDNDNDNDDEETSPYNEDEEEEDDDNGLVIEDADYVDEETPAQHVNSVYMDGDDGSAAGNAHLAAHHTLHEQEDTDNGELVENDDFDDYDHDQSIDYTD